MSHITSRRSTWLALLLLLSIHLTMNYLAVRAVAMNTFNRQRACIAYGIFKETRVCMTPFEVAERERIFQSGNTLRHPLRHFYFGTARICRTFDDFLKACANGRSRTESTKLTQDLLELFDRAKYVLCPAAHRTGTLPNRIYLCFKVGATPRDVLAAWLHAYEFAALLRANSRYGFEDLVTPIRISAGNLSESFQPFVAGCERLGWNISAQTIITSPIHHFSVDPDDDSDTQKM